MSKQTYQYFNLLEWHERETRQLRCACFDTSNLSGIVIAGAIQVWCSLLFDVIPFRFYGAAS